MCTRTHARVCGTLHTTHTTATVSECANHPPHVCTAGRERKCTAKTLCSPPPLTHTPAHDRNAPWRSPGPGCAACAPNPHHSGTRARTPTNHPAPPHPPPPTHDTRLVTSTRFPLVCACVRPAGPRLCAACQVCIAAPGCLYCEVCEGTVCICVCGGACGEKWWTTPIYTPPPPQSHLATPQAPQGQAGGRMPLTMALDAFCQVWSRCSLPLPSCCVACHLVLGLFGARRLARVRRSHQHLRLCGATLVRNALFLLMHALLLPRCARVVHVVPCSSDVHARILAWSVCNARVCVCVCVCETSVCCLRFFPISPALFSDFVCAFSDFARIFIPVNYFSLVLVIPSEALDCWLGVSDWYWCGWCLVLSGFGRLSRLTISIVSGSTAHHSPSYICTGVFAHHTRTHTLTPQPQNKTLSVVPPPPTPPHTHTHAHHTLTHTLTPQPQN